MKAFIGVLCALLIASSQCQQMFTLETCLYHLGLLTGDLSLVFRERQATMHRQTALGRLQLVQQHCSFALNTLGAARSLGEDSEECKKLKGELKMLLENQPERSGVNALKPGEGLMVSEFLKKSKEVDEKCGKGASDKIMKAFEDKRSKGKTPAPTPSENPTRGPTRATIQRPKKHN